MTQITDLRTLIDPLTTEPPRAVFFDAMGTLFGLQQSVGDIYGAIANRHQVTVNPDQLSQVFYQRFKAAPPLAFGPLPADELKQREFDWWRNLAQGVFQQLGVWAQFTDFDAYFADLYHYFASPDPWIVYDDVLPLLTACQAQGIPLSVLSNFDSRLLAILEALELASYFEQVFLSARCPAAKPDRQIFQQALDAYQLSPQDAWHIGDSHREDYLGAQAAGLQAFLINR